MKRSIKYLCAFVVIAFATAIYAEMPEIPRGKGEFCVAPTDVMRKEHMSFLLHQRDETVLKGVRTKKHSLVGCIDCHVQTNEQGEYIPVDAPAQFCEVCHSFASVKLDCFECHATTPDENHSAAYVGDAEHYVDSTALEQEIKRYIARSRSGNFHSKNQ